jgi:hypothetical protein
VVSRRAPASGDPFAIFLGAGPITNAVEGTLLNLADLIP